MRISERRVHGTVTDLPANGYLTKHREGRRNRYAIDTERPLGQGLTADRTVGDLVALLTTTADGATAG